MLDTEDAQRRSDEINPLLSHFFAELAALPRMAVDRGEGRSETSSEPEWIATALSSAARQAVVAAATSAGSVQAILCAAWAKLLSVYCGTDRVAFGARLGLEDAAGPARSTGDVCGALFPISLSIPKTGNLADWCKSVQWALEAICASSPITREALRDAVGSEDSGALLGSLLEYFEGAPAASSGELDVCDDIFSKSVPPLLVRVTSGEALKVALRYYPHRIERAEAADILEQFSSLLEQIASGAAGHVNSLDVAQNRARDMIHNWNATQAKFSDQATLHGLFEEQAAKRPDAPALIHEGRCWTYSQVDEDANRLANFLLRHGASVGHRVGLSAQKSAEALVAILACMKIGACYVPLDPNYPDSRLGFMIEDAGLSLLLAGGRGRRLAGSSTVPSIDLDLHGWRAESAVKPLVDVSADLTAYMIFTSGSTGRPKCIVLNHRGRVNNILDYIERIDCGPSDRLLSVSSLSFDISVANIFCMLLSGGVLIFPDHDREVDVAHWVELAEINQVTVWHSVPALIEVMLEEWELRAPPPVRVIFSSGDRISVSLPIRLRKRLPELAFFSFGGATELSVDSSIYEVIEVDPKWRSIPYGRPMKNQTAYVLDDTMSLVPVGVPGELHFGGVGVGEGYFGRPELTAEKFVPDPFSEKPGQRLYKTGDLARYMPDGTLEFLGRNDFQVKIRGFRIELGEIEARLTDCPGVREVSVLAREFGAGDKRLIAYVKVAELDNGPSVQTLRAHVAAALPDYMVPAAFVRLEAFPLTPNGKLDRKALPPPGGEAFGRGEYVPPLGPVEEPLARIWAELLGVERVGRHDNFFELGGHSLLAVRVLSQVGRVLNAESTLEALFAHSTLSDFAETLVLRSERGPAIVRTARDGAPELSFAQQRLWFLTQLEGGSAAYHVPSAFRLQGKLDTAALERALDRLVSRHEALRTRFDMRDGKPAQRIDAPGAGFGLRHEDLRRAGAHLAAELERLELEEASAPFDLAAGPLVRGRLLRLSDQDHVLLITMHHIVSDGWSIGVLTRELSALYTAFAQGLPDPLEPLEIQYADYAVWQRERLSSPVLAEQSEYWRKRLAGAPTVLELPTDRPRPTRQDFAGAMAPIEIDEVLTRKLKALSQARGMTLFMTVLAGWAVVLSRLSRQDEIVIGAPSANRAHAEIEGLIGLFVNTLALRVDLSGTPDVSTVLERVKATALAAQAHQDLPFEQVVEVINPPRSPGHTPIYQAMFAWQSNDVRLAMPGLSMEWRPSASTTSKVDVLLELSEVEGRIIGRLEYATALFDAETIGRWSGYFRRTLEQMATDQTQLVGTLDILAPAERRQMLETWNATQADYPEHFCVHELFEAQAGRAPHALALAHGGEQLSYGELNARANQLAHHLRDLGVGPDVLVAICMERSIHVVIALLAVLKAGGAYVPLDPTYPAARLAFLLTDCAPAAVLTYGATRQIIEGIMPVPGGAPVLDLAASAPAWAERSVLRPQPGEQGPTPENLAYVIYTSGSTGAPKGVMIEHRSLINYLHWAWDTYVSDDVTESLVSTSLAFDATVTSLLVPLVKGLCVRLLDEDDNLQALGDAIGAGAYPLAKLTPAHLEVLRTLYPQLQARSAGVLVVGGEALEARQIDMWRDRSASLRMINEYGPTEATVGCVVHEINTTTPRTGPVPIGRPISNTRIYLLDALLQPTPLGVTGEVFIGGAGVARGYLNRPELTAVRFIDSPFVKGDRLYATGDLARYLPDGTLEFLGRNDFQVKIRGFRIELGEIEARLASHPLVHEVVVLAREDQADDRRLVAYYTAGSQAPSTDALRDYVAAALPDYMAPAAFVLLAAFPLTSNGKLDRKALPPPGEEAFGRDEYVPPVGPIEDAVARIWAEVLAVKRVGRHDNFFELGGHSLMAVRVLSQVGRVLSAKSTLAALFTHPTLSAFAESLVLGGEQGAAIVPVDRNAPLDLSFAQQRLWFLTQLEGVSQAYHIPLGLQLRGALDVPALERALNRLVWRHEALRTVLAADDGQAIQRILPADTGFELRRHDLQGQADALEQLSTLSAQEASAPFDLETGPLFRGRLINLSAQEHVLLLTMHHIVSDGWSLGVLRRELGMLYEAFSRGQTDPLEPLAIQYPDYAAWQRRWLSGATLKRQSDYWLEALSGAPALLALPTDRPRPTQQDFSGGHVELELDEALTAELKALSQRRGMTLFMTVLAGWALVLSRLSGQDDVVIGTPSANRVRPEVEGLIGSFVNTLALRVDLSDTPTVTQVLEQVRARALEAQEHQDLPFEQVVEMLRPARNLAQTPIFQAMFDWRNNEDSALGLSGLDVEVMEVGESKAKFDLTLNLGEAGERITGSITYASALFDAATVERYADYLRRILAQMVANENQLAGALDILSPAEREHLLTGLNQTQAAYPLDQCVHQLFEDQARRDPSALAVTYEAQSLSYGALNARANRLAHHLRALGVRPDDRVAICMDRSLEMVVGLLAILKAGGAYVPLDPAYPLERLTYMLGDAVPMVALTHRAARPALEAALTGLVQQPVSLDLDADLAAWAEQPDSDPDPAVVGLTSSHLAYVIYTSGSTGQPKGVMVEHANVAAISAAWKASYALRPGLTWLQMASISFDVFAADVVRSLCFGGRLVICPREVLVDAAALAQLMRAEQVAIGNFVPAVLSRLVDHLEAAGERLAFMETVICGGDIWAPSEARRLRALCAPSAQVFNVFGVTEATVDSSYYPFDDQGLAESTTTPIGRPIANTRIYLLDGHGQLVPAGMAGEIHIGGAGVARGYLNRPELTAEKFIASPFVEGDRIYKTGDLARYLPDGNIEFLGRNDFQVKIRGFRIELGEIEARLTAHPGVREAVVLARDDLPGDERLVGYYIPEADETIEAAALREYLGVSLPEHMVPAAYVPLAAWPVTPNGKVDRRALPAPGQEAYGVRTYEAPNTPLERAIADIWSSVLSLPMVGRHDNFFDLGGHSLLVTRVCLRLQELIGGHVPIRTLFEAPTVATTAEWLLNELRFAPEKAEN